LEGPQTDFAHRGAGARKRIDVADLDGLGLCPDGDQAECQDEGGTLHGCPPVVLETRFFNGHLKRSALTLSTPFPKCRTALRSLPKDQALTKMNGLLTRRAKRAPSSQRSGTWTKIATRPSAGGGSGTRPFRTAAASTVSATSIATAAIPQPSARW